MMENWELQAACRDSGIDFFDEENEQPALDCCARCRVRVHCLEMAMTAEGNATSRHRFGIFGGRTPLQRARMRSGTVRRSA